METEGKVVGLGAKCSGYCGALSISPFREQLEREQVLKFRIRAFESARFLSSAV